MPEIKQKAKTGFKANIRMSLKSEKKVNRLRTCI